MPPPAPGYYPPPPPMPPKRPIGVTILAVLTILFGIGLFLLGLLLAVVGALFATVTGLGLIALLAGVLFLLVGIMMLAAGVGLLRLRMWAWWLAIIAFALGTVSSLISDPPIWASAVILVLLIVYLVLVRKHFGTPRPMGM